LRGNFERRDTVKKGILDNNVIVQIGMVVNDIEKTAGEFADFFGIDKPNVIVTDGYDKSRAQYMGKPCNAKAKLAFIRCGSLDLELIEPDREPSTWREFLDANGEGVHHIAFVVKGMQEKIAGLEKKGIKLVQKGEYTGGRYAYLDASKPLKLILELLEND
jgi:methylmalonyl-CoA/ethylmalonyl-CoA epimerase